MSLLLEKAICMTLHDNMGYPRTGAVIVTLQLHLNDDQLHTDDDIM